ncbi:uncharacterized protein N7511_003403 [Penicillium nucicola]|uniref:uncharacterized protein n=1 Tax=Penicillium nucicola TaxID=1850975 RepID=UPI0025450BEA|nr:uncharacterized protein N7511_003403 [Penicillium nucicola]KAJ5771352.1 hypothetical protein N7511_003403 [Penicillium nucicola]
MAGDEYSVGGGKLKLKGSKVSGGRVEKKKKKSSKKKEDSASASGPGTPAETQIQRSAVEGDSRRDSTPIESRVGKRDHAHDNDHDDGGDQVAEREREFGSGKTETERKYEEIRRKRLHERLQREGVKTHKEKVEELNKYLSRLSEHHDMPKIGPG